MYNFATHLKINGYYLLTAVLFIGILFISNKYFKGSQYAAVGLAETRSYKINSDKSAIVSKIFTNEGETVNAGDTLLILVNPELEIEIGKTNRRINQLHQEQITEDRVTKAELDFIEASEGIVLEELESDMQKLKAEMRLNETLNIELGKKNDADSKSGNPKQVELTSLTKQYNKQQEAINLKKLEVKQKHAVAKAQFNNQIELLQKELELLQQQNKRLVKTASTRGVIQSIYVKPSEQIDAYTALMSVNPIHPTTVVAYANERNRMNFEIGQKVKVTAQRDKDLFVEGTIKGFGSVTALPTILQKSTAVAAYGQEIFIEIPAENNFANGEKVIIR